MRRIHQPEPKLALGPAATGTGKVGRQVALKLLLGKWAAVAEDASAGTFDDEGAPARCVSACIRERFRNGVADDGVAAKFLRGCVKYRESLERQRPDAPVHDREFES